MASRSKLFNYLAKRTIYIVIVILITLAAVIGTFIVQARRQANSQVLVDTFGLQRSYVQSMTKDANRIYNITDLMENPEADLGALEDELAEAKSNLEQTIGKYEDTISSLEQGYLSTQYGKIDIYERNLEALESSLEENRKVWNEIRPEYENMLAVDSPDDEEIGSLPFINQNEGILMDQTDKLTSVFLNENQQIYSGNMNRVLVFIISLTILLVYAMYEFYKYLFLPLDQFYSGFREIGLTTVSSQRHKGLRSVSDEIARMLGGVVKSMNLIEDINTNMSFEESLDHIYKSFSMYIPYSYIGIALFKDKETDVLVGSYGIGDGKVDKEMTGIIGYEVNVKETSLEKIMHDEKPRIINDLDIYFKDRPIKNYSRIVLNAGIKSSITLPLIANDDCIGFIFFSSMDKNAYNEEHIKFLRIISSSIAISFQKNIFIEDLLYASLIALTKISEEKDQNTGEHLHRMKTYSTVLAKLMKKSSYFMDEIDAAFIIDIEKFSPMHDIGKVGIPDDILRKPDKLDSSEFEVMKSHTTNGAKVLIEAEENIKKSGKSMFGMGIEIASSHHEKWDGSGYPNGLKGEEIPLSGRIVAVADVLDALLSKRPYKKSFTFDESISIIREGKGNHFDPNIIDVLEENLEVFKAIHQKQLSLEEV